MTDKRNNLMQEIEIYGNGFLSDETIEHTADMIMELDPAPSTIDEIDADLLNDIIQAADLVTTTELIVKALGVWQIS